MTNPYAPPAVDTEALDVSEAPYWRLRPASNGRRFATFLLDYIGVMIAAMLFGAFSYFLSGGANDGGFLQPFGILLMVGYYLFFEGLWGRTPGKWLLGTRVVDNQGRRPTFGAVFIRTIVRFVPFEAFSFLGSRRGGWHDRWSSTHVIRMRDRDRMPSGDSESDDEE